MVIIAPSILSADFLNLKDDVAKVEKAGADWLHLDIMDGQFVPNLTFGPMIIKQLRPHSKLVFDTHLMVENPEKMLEWFAQAGSDIITVHFEACNNLSSVLKQIKALGKKTGVSLKPATNAEVLRPFLDDIDLILVMSVEPGFGGQSFRFEQLEKVEKLKKICENRNILIEIDGGINPQTAKLAINAGADVLVAGSSIFNSNDYAKSIKDLR